MEKYLVKIVGFHKFTNKWSKKKVMVNVTMEMPEEIWLQELGLVKNEHTEKLLNLIKGEKS